MIITKLFILFVLFLKVFSNPVLIPDSNILSQLFKRKGTSGGGGRSGGSISSGSSSSSSGTKGGSGSSTSSSNSGARTNWGNNQYHCGTYQSRYSCGYGNYYAPTAAAAAAGYGTARYHNTNSTAKSNGVDLKVPDTRVYWLGLAALGAAVL
ncbi:hypothetical protein G210_0992 [Candida maltosa Xu316]|uniref:Uncharacterized protein n=1 Tax=Candida maltosa (strain Xu316) TaxID=1245528 RepID=M3HLX5_CANMX|nr:hypothetical protein G210_0992 [Candida maltosa Xu316]